MPAYRFACITVHIFLNYTLLQFFLQVVPMKFYDLIDNLLELKSNTSPARLYTSVCLLYSSAEILSTWEVFLTIKVDRVFWC